MTGTPVAGSLRDLGGLLAFIRHQPFETSSLFNRTLLLDNNLGKLRRILGEVMFRHGQEDVACDVSIPHLTVRASIHGRVTALASSSCLSGGDGARVALARRTDMLRSSLPPVPRDLAELVGLNGESFSSRSCSPHEPTQSLLLSRIVGPYLPPRSQHSSTRHRRLSQSRCGRERRRAFAAGGEAAIATRGRDGA